MTALTVLKSGTEDGADKALDIIQNLAQQQLITVQAAAIVTWPRGKKKPKTKQLNYPGHIKLAGRVVGFPGVGPSPHPVRR